MLTLSRRLSIPISVAILGLFGTALPVSAASALARFTAGAVACFLPLPSES